MNKLKLCDVLGCYNKVYAKNLCKYHYCKTLKGESIEKPFLLPELICDGNLLEDEKEFLNNVLEELPQRDSLIIKSRFGLGDFSPHTLTQTAKRFGITRERVRQIEAEALRKLRHPARGLKGLLYSK